MWLHCVTTWFSETVSGDCINVLHIEKNVVVTLEGESVVRLFQACLLTLIPENKNTLNERDIWPTVSVPVRAAVSISGLGPRNQTSSTLRLSNLHIK